MEGNMILYAAIWTAIILTGLSLLGLVLFGVRSLTYGKSNPLTIAMIAFPGVVLLVLGFAMGDWVQAGILTTIVMFACSLVGLVWTGISNMIW